MDELITYVARSLVDHPDDVAVTANAADDENGTDVYELAVAQPDLGRVIGRHGRTARAMRAVVRAAAAKTGRKAQLEIVE